MFISKGIMNNTQYYANVTQQQYQQQCNQQFNQKLMTQEWVKQHTDAINRKKFEEDQMEKLRVYDGLTNTQRLEIEQKRFEEEQKRKSEEYYKERIRQASDPNFAIEQRRRGEVYKKNLEQQKKLQKI